MRAFMSHADAKVRAILLLKTLYPTASGFRSQAQEDIAIDVLSTEEDMIWVAACGEGKTIALLMAAVLCAEQGKVTVVISPQRNIMLSLREQLEKADIVSRIFTGDNDMDICAGDSFATKGPAFSVLLFSIESLAKDKRAWAAIEALGRFDRLAMIFADEIHLHLSSPSFRDAFSRAGDLRARIGRRTRFLACTATLAVNAVPALMEQLLLVPSQTVVRRSGTLLGHRFSLRVENVPGDPCKLRLKQLIVEWAGKYAQDRTVGRMAVLVTSVDKARQLQGEAQEFFRASLSEGVQEICAGSATGEDSLESVTAVINTCDLVFCTTFLCTSANMFNLRHAVIFQTAFSLADFVQFLGRLAREVDAFSAVAVFLFDKQFHGHLFGQPSSRFARQKDAEIVLACFADDTDGARLQLAPSYVARLALCAHTSCVMEELNRVFVRANGGACKDLHGENKGMYCGYCTGIEVDVAVAADGGDAHPMTVCTASSEHHEEEEGEEEEGGCADPDGMIYMDEEVDGADWGSTMAHDARANGASSHGQDAAVRGTDKREREEEASSSDELDEEECANIVASITHMQDAPRYERPEQPGTGKGAKRRLYASAPAPLVSTPSRHEGGKAGGAWNELGAYSMATCVEVTPQAASKRTASQDDDLLLDDRVAPPVTIPLSSASIASNGAVAFSGETISTVSSQTNLQKNAFLRLAEIHMHNILDAYQQLSYAISPQGRLPCLGCKSVRCNGFRGDKDICPALERKKGLICFKCGGCHKKCSREWQVLLGRCKLCFMPWDDTLGCTFHYGSSSSAGKGKSAADKEENACTCLAIGDAFKSTLCRLWWSSDAQWHAFVAAVRGHCIAQPPTRSNEIDTFMLWLAKPTAWGNGMFHIDLAIEYVLATK